MSQVFLCYSLQDERDAATIRDELLERGLNVWWEAEVPTSKNWACRVARALEKSDSMIVLVSPEAMASDLVKRELQHALRSRQLRDRLFPVMIRPTYVVPWCFRKLPMFDLTKNRTRGLGTVVKAIKTPRGRASDSG